MTSAAVVARHTSHVTRHTSQVSHQQHFAAEKERALQVNDTAAAQSTLH